MGECFYTGPEVFFLSQRSNRPVRTTAPLLVRTPGHRPAPSGLDYPFTRKLSRSRPVILPRCGNVAAFTERTFSLGFCEVVGDGVAPIVHRYL